jgi:hypothetical protein
MAVTAASQHQQADQPHQLVLRLGRAAAFWVSTAPTTNQAVATAEVIQ